MNDNLVAQNPRDSIILLREKRLQEIREAKRFQASQSHDIILRKYAKQFFKDDTVFDTLDPLQKKELAKMCASYCRRWSAGFFYPIASSLFAVLSLGIFSASGWFVVLIPWLILSLGSIGTFGVGKDSLGHVNVEHFWPFLKAYKKINSAEKKTTAEIESGVEEND